MKSSITVAVAAAALPSIGAFTVSPSQNHVLSASSLRAAEDAAVVDAVVDAAPSGGAGEGQAEVVLVGCGAPNRGMGWYHAIQMLEGR